MSGDLIQSVIDDALAGRRYRFIVHGSPQQSKRRKRRKNRGGRNEPYRVHQPQQFSMRKFAKPANLMAAFRILRAEGGNAPGIDGRTYDDFAPREIWGALRTVSCALLDYSYRPHPTRLIRVPKSDGRFRELSLHNVVDRAVAKALQLALDPYWISVLPNLRRSVWEIYAEMEHVIRAEQRYFLTTADIENCFPSIPIGDVLDCHRQHIQQPDLLWLLENVIRGHDGSDHTRGLPQGSPYSPPSAELMLHTCLDQQMDADPGNPPVFRYADNLQILNTSVQEGQEALETLQETLEPYYLNVKREGITNLRNPHEGQALGLVPRWEEDHLVFSLTERTFQKLEKNLENALNSVQPSLVAIQIIEGWLTAIAPVFSTTDALDIVRRVKDVAAKSGFREMPQKHLLEVTENAKKQWQKTHRDTLSRICQREIEKP